MPRTTSNPKSVQLNVRLTPEALAKINEGKECYTDKIRGQKLSMSDFIESRCSIDSMDDFAKDELIDACVSSINYEKACIEIFESFMELFGDGTLGKQICHDNKNLSDMVAWGKAVVKRMQKCAGIPVDTDEE